MEDNKMIRDNKDRVMIVIIAILAIVLAIVLVFFFIERSENKENIAIIEMEKVELTQELTDLSSSYEQMKTDNDTLNNKLVLEQEKIAALLDKMKEFRNNSYAEINRYKKEIGTLKTVLRSYVVQIDSLNQLNQKLTAQYTEAKQQIDYVRDRNKVLEDQQKNMKEVIDLASALKTENFVVYPVNKKNKEIRWEKCFNLKADFTIIKNVTAKRGEKTVYLRIMRPDNKAIAFNEKSFFKYDNASLTYTAKRDISYEGERLEVSIYWPNDGSLIKGTYKAELFCDNEIIGATEFTFK